MVEQQLSMVDIEGRDWVKEIQAMCESMVLKHGLPPNSVFLQENMGREGKEDKSNTIISRSVCLYEPDYPETTVSIIDSSKNTVLMNIKINELKKTEDRFEVLVNDGIRQKLGDIPGMENNGLNKGTSFCEYRFVVSRLESVLDDWLEYIEKLIEYGLKNYISKARTFGCCSRYADCSEKGFCIHPNKMYACACAYKRHLENGEIFYGSRRNV